MNKTEIVKKADTIKRYSFSLWPGYLGFQVILFIVQFAFKAKMPWYIMWFPSLLVGGILAGVIAIALVVAVVGGIIVGDFFLFAWLIGEYDGKGIALAIIINILIIAVVLLIIFL